MTIDRSAPPQRPQRQDAAEYQLTDLQAVANRLDHYHDTDAIVQLCLTADNLEYGCQVEVCIEPDLEPDSCVIDENRHHECIYAKPGTRKG